MIFNKSLSSIAFFRTSNSKSPPFFPCASRASAKISLATPAKTNLVSKDKDGALSSAGEFFTGWRDVFKAVWILDIILHRPRLRFIRVVIFGRLRLYRRHRFGLFFIKLDDTFHDTAHGISLFLI